MAFEAVRLATKYMTPVLLLSDSYLANCAEPMLIPDADALPDIAVRRTGRACGLCSLSTRPADAGAPLGGARHAGHGASHRRSGERGCHGHSQLRCRQPSSGWCTSAPRRSRGSPPISRSADVVGDEQGELLIVGWGSTYGAIAAAVDELRRAGRSVSHLHLRYLNPFPAQPGRRPGRFRRVLVPENNLGQLTVLLRAKFPVVPESFTKVDGRPFLIREIQAKVEEILSRD